MLFDNKHMLLLLRKLRILFGDNHMLFLQRMLWLFAEDAIS